MNFKVILEKNIWDYINKNKSKIKDIHTFGNIIKLIKVDRIKREKKKKEYFRIIKVKYKFVIKDNIKLIKENKEF